MSPDYRFKLHEHLADENAVITAVAVHALFLFGVGVTLIAWVVW